MIQGGKNHRQPNCESRKHWLSAPRSVNHYFASEISIVSSLVQCVFFLVHRIGHRCFERGGRGLRRSVVGFVEFDADDLAHAVLC